MIKGAIGVGLGVTLLLAGWAQAEGPKARENACSELGRYQLFQGKYTAFDLRRHETYTQESVFLLDTKTGKVLRYVNKVDQEGKYIETWLPTDLSLEKK